MALQRPDGREPKEAQQPRKRGGRSGEHLYKERLAEEICHRLAAGESLRAICRDPDMPDERTVRGWVMTPPGGAEGFATQYARAREMGYDSVAEEIIEISDADITFNGAPDNALVQRARLMSDNRKWFLSKALPKKYGDKVTQELVGNPDQPIVNRIELVAVDPRPALLPRARIDNSDDVEG